MTSASSGCLLRPATGFAGSLMTMALPMEVGWASASVNWLSNVYCSNTLLDDAVFRATTLVGHGGACMTCLVAACVAALFHIIPFMVFSACCLANSWITSETHTQRWGQCVCWAIGGFSHPCQSLHSIWDMRLGLSTTYSNHCYLAFYTDHQSVCHNIQECWMSPRIWSWRHEPRLWVLPFGTTARNLHLVDLKCCQALAWQLGGMLPRSLTRFASYWLTISWYLAVSQMGQVLKHKLMPSHASEHAIKSCALQVCFLPFLALAISRASLNSGLSMEHMCCHVFLPAHVFPSSLGTIPVTEIRGSPFPHGGAILNMGGCPSSSVVCDPTACMMLALLASAHQLVPTYQPNQGRSSHIGRMGGGLDTSSFSGWIFWRWVLIQNLRNQMGHPNWLVFFCPAVEGHWAPCKILYILLKYICQSYMFLLYLNIFY